MRETGLTYLTGLSIVHAALDKSLSAFPELELRPKLPELTLQMEKFEKDVKVITPVIKASLDMAHEIFSHSHNRSKLKTYRSVLENWPSIPNQTEDSEAADRAFGYLKQVSEHLTNYKPEDLSPSLAAINPETGNHQFPSDPKKIALAIKAGVSARLKFPYLDVRFGDRSRRFTSSDSCWLVWLYEKDDQIIESNLKWLSEVLASRGMPTVILETLLLEIDREFNSSRPSFLKFANFLKTERSQIIPDHKFQKITHDLDVKLNACPGFKVPGASAIILAAFCDEKRGLAGAMKSTAPWFEDDSRFSEAWIQQVKQFTKELSGL